jgi:excisionase family DNA binding protein
MREKNLPANMEAEMDREGQRWLTVPETSQLLKIPRTRTYELIASGELPAVRIGQRSIRVNQQELEKFLLLNRRIVAQ